MKQLPGNIFVSGIGTNVGKTVVSAVLTEALKADYWKPVQSGCAEDRDREQVERLISNDQSKIHEEAYCLQEPSVPVFAAEKEGLEIEPGNLALPRTSNRLVIEGAGGLMVHLRRDLMIIDWLQMMGLPLILVSENYLGSINHSLLSIEALRSRKMEILGIIYNGACVRHMRELVNASGVPELGSIDPALPLDKHFVKQQAEKLYVSLQQFFDLP